MLGDMDLKVKEGLREVSCTWAYANQFIKMRNSKNNKSYHVIHSSCDSRLDATAISMNL